VDQARDLGADDGVVVDVDRDVVGEAFAHTTQVGKGGACCSVRSVDTEPKLSQHHQSQRKELVTNVIRPAHLQVLWRSRWHTSRLTWMRSWTRQIAGHLGWGTARTIRARTTATSPVRHLSWMDRRARSAAAATATWATILL
jgi:hypothetical protein